MNEPFGLGRLQPQEGSQQLPPDPEQNKGRCKSRVSKKEASFIKIVI